MADASVVIRLNPASIQTLLASPAGPVAQEIRVRGNRVLNKARELCPVDQGALRASLTLEMFTVDGLPVARVGSRLKYAIYVHEGTGIYAGRGYIYPRSARVLRWPARAGSPRRYSGGATARYVYARRVRGVPGRPFLRQALAAA